MLAPPRDDVVFIHFFARQIFVLTVVILSKAKDLKVYVTVDGRTHREILRYVQDDIVYNSSRHCEELHANAFVIPLTVYAIPWQSTIDYSALLILTQVALHRP